MKSTGMSSIVWAVFVFRNSAADFEPIAFFSKEEDAHSYRAANPIVDEQKTVVAGQQLYEIVDHLIATRLRSLGLKLEIVPSEPHVCSPTIAEFALEGGAVGPGCDTLAASNAIARKMMGKA